ncbi:S8 family serine peptidase [Confluentibacter flavum]|uniref:Serine protease n=1 Tax=Confluentibacter flavum TaxID=1909700 RepID=A0A2N3HIU9_9FLAO|nr:S8 family serine peptidase [Confluentibacter flavum]PKQ44833.1 serine protease [Confluentibacter flavum]
MKKGLLFLILLFFQIYVNAQQDAWIYLADKQNVAASVANPITILTQKAIDRKNGHGIAIDDRDVPVNESYITQLKNSVGITVMAKSKWFNAVHIRGSQTDIEALTGLGFIASIDFADTSLNTAKPVSQKHASKLESELITFNYGNAFNQIDMINGHELHLLDYTGMGMTVAVLDAGFPNVNTMSAFQRLRNATNIIDGYDFVNRNANVYANTTSSHGTWVLSTMAGYVQDQYVGTAPDASYYLFITEDALSENPVEESYWVEAAERADSLGVDVINSSLGYGSFYDNTNYNFPASDFDGNTTYITKGANIAFEKGLLIVNSAGNEGSGGINAPADSPNVLSIGAVTAAGTYASFSSVGSTIQPTQKPDVVAQGQASYVVDINDVIGTLNGTSFSSPILAGGIVCLWQALPNKTNAEIMQLVRESASQYNNPDYFLGYGIPNLLAALNTELSIDNDEDNPEEILLFPNPSSGEVYLKLPSEEPFWTFSLYDILGRQVNTFPILDVTDPIDVSSLLDGLYIVKIESPKISKTFKLIKK